eukprot:g40227.t1
MKNDPEMLGLCLQLYQIPIHAKSGFDTRIITTPGNTVEKNLLKRVMLQFGSVTQVYPLSELELDSPVDVQESLCLDSHTLSRRCLALVSEAGAPVTSDSKRGRQQPGKKWGKRLRAERGGCGTVKSIVAGAQCGTWPSPERGPVWSVKLYLDIFVPEMVLAYKYKLEHHPETQVANADALNCLPLANTPPVVPPLEESILVLNFLDILPVIADSIRQKTQKDPVLAKLKQLVVMGETEGALQP